MKKINVIGPSIVGNGMQGNRKLPSEELLRKEKNNGVIIVDARSKEDFATGHIPGAINLPYGTSFSNWAGWILPGDGKIALVLDPHQQPESVVWSLLRVGIDGICGILQGGMEVWKAEDRKVREVAVLTPSILHEKLKEREQLYVLDVRTEGEWNAGHIAGAHHIHLGLLTDHIDQLPKDRSIAVICGSGMRSSIASSLLLRKGITHVFNVFGGMTQWKKVGLPTE